MPLNKHLSLLLVTSVCLIQGMASASEIDVRAGNVQVTTSRRGNTYIDTGYRQLSVSPRRFSTGTSISSVVNPYVRQSLRISCSGRGYLYQEINQINQSEGGIVRTQSSTYECR